MIIVTNVLILTIKEIMLTTDKYDKFKFFK